MISYLPELRSSWRISPELTMRSLLSQSGGLFAEEALRALLALGDGDDALLGAARLVVSGEQVAPPGSAWAYYNGNYWLAGAVLARVRECAFEEALASLVLEPAGLTSTGFETPAGGVGAFGHFKEHVPVAQKYPRARRPSGGLWSTVTDLLRLGDFLLDDPGLIATMRVPVIEAQPGVSYGLGCFLLEDLVLHPGGWGGFRSLLVLAPAHHLAATIVLNEAADDPVHDAVIGSVVGALLRADGIANPWPDRQPAVSSRRMTARTGVGRETHVKPQDSNSGSVP